MPDLFCLHCEPTRPGEHQLECLLFTPSKGEEEIVEEYLDLVARFAEMSGLSEEAVKRVVKDKHDLLKYFIKTEKK